MAEIGYGYGSEFQLMRFLGHHRQELNKMIKNATGESENIQWLDFPFDDNKISGDGEWKGINCFKLLENKDDFKAIKSKWKDFWPQRGTAMNWDGIFRIGKKWFFVEAKAHEEECFQKCNSTHSVSRKTISDAFEKTKGWLDATKTENQWIDTDCYQLANRLAFLYFCKEICGIDAGLVYIGFVNGYRSKKDEVIDSCRWKEIWEKELETLGLTMEKVRPYLSFVYPTCEDRNG